MMELWNAALLLTLELDPDTKNSCPVTTGCIDDSEQCLQRHIGCVSLYFSVWPALPRELSMVCFMSMLPNLARAFQMQLGQPGMSVCDTWPAI